MDSVNRQRAERMKYGLDRDFDFAPYLQKYFHTKTIGMLLPLFLRLLLQLCLALPNPLL